MLLLKRKRTYITDPIPLARGQNAWINFRSIVNVWAETPSYLAHIAFWMR